MINKRILVCIFILAMVLVCVFSFVLQKHSLTKVPVEENLQIQQSIDPPMPKEATRDEARASIRKEDIKALVGYLCTFNGRMSGSSENIECSHFIQEQFQNFGIKEELDGFKLGGQQTQNVYGWVFGKEDSSSCLIVGAHFDGQGPGNPSADDDASGTAGVLMLARAFSMLRNSVPKTIIFQLYSAEEMGMYGSGFYVKHPKFPLDAPNIKSHSLMLNLDMIGHLNNRDPKSMFNFGVTGGASDHMSFYNAGVPSYFVHTGMHQKYHKPTDTPDSLDYVGMEKLLRYVYDVVWYNMGKEQ